MDTLGKLRLSYAVETVKPGSNGTPYENNPRTGDTTSFLKYILMMTAAVLVGILAFLSWRKDRKDGDEA